MTGILVQCDRCERIEDFNERLPSGVIAAAEYAGWLMSRVGTPKDQRVDICPRCRTDTYGGPVGEPSEVRK